MGGRRASPPPAGDVAALPGGDLLFLFIVAELGAFALDAALVGLLGGPAPNGSGRQTLLLLAPYYCSALCLGAAVAYWLRARGLGAVLAAWLRPVPARVLLTGAAAGAGLKLLGGAVALLEERAVARIVPNNPVVTSPLLFRDPLRVALLGAAAVVLAPLAEELFYRGLLFRWLAGRMRWEAAAGLSGLLFGMAHLDPTLVLPLAVVGAGLAALARQAGSLWPCVAAHACLNALSIALALTAR
jgi:membrane protease YdiL (CAAX protease family)